MNDPFGELLLFSGATIGGLLIALLVTHLCLSSLAGYPGATYAICFAVVFILESVFRVREYADKSIDLQIIVKVASWMYIFAFAITRLPRYVESLVSLPQLAWLLFFGLALYSSSYSPSPAYSLAAIFSVVAFYLYFISLYSEYDEVAVLTSVTAAMATIAACSLIVYFAAPQLGRFSEWRDNVYTLGTRLSGIAGQPNAMGEICAFGLLVLIFCWREARDRLGSVLSWSFIIVLAVALVMSYSRSSISLVLMILAAKRLLHTRYLPWIAFCAMLGITCLLLLIPFSEQVMVALSRSGDAAEIETGTSRTQIWDTVTKLAEMKFWTGWGYGASVFILPHYSAYMKETAPHAHDLVLQIWLTMGALGVIVFVAAFLLQFIEAAIRRDGLSVLLLSFVIVNGLMEPGAFAGIASMPTVALAIAVARSCRRSTAIRSRRRWVTQFVGSAHT
jgi:O-antigen ligase